MKLLVIRHAIAMDAEEFADKGESDDRRPLTPYGAKRMRKNTKGLRTIVEKIDSFATSPYTRAIETAEIISEIYERDQAELCASLVPGIAFEDFEAWARTFDESEVLGIVGHEPHLSTLVTWLLYGSSESRIQLKKGGACLLDMGAEVAPGKARLLWSASPKLLRAVARRV